MTAEVNRDGVFDVTLVEDPAESNGSYVLNYLSKGKRGEKHYICKISIASNMLFVLTAQVLEASYTEKRDEMLQCIKSFRTS